MSWTWRGKGYLCHSESKAARQQRVTNTMNDNQNIYGRHKAAAESTKNLTKAFKQNVIKNVINTCEKKNWFGFITAPTDQQAETIYISNIMPLIEQTMNEEYMKIDNGNTVGPKNLYLFDGISTSEMNNIADELYKTIHAKRPSHGNKWAQKVTGRR